jgi:hypothetical protein
MENNIFFPFGVGLLVARFTLAIDKHPDYVTIFAIVSLVIGCVNVGIREFRKKLKTPLNQFKKSLEIKISQGEKILENEKIRKKLGKETNERRLQELINWFCSWREQWGRIYKYGFDVACEPEKYVLTFWKKNKLNRPKTHAAFIFWLEMDLVFLSSLKNGVTDIQLSSKLDPEKLRGEKNLKYPDNLLFD